MLDWMLGLGAFAMFFIYDWNRVFVKKSWMNPLFAAGNMCLAVVAVRLVLEAFSLSLGKPGAGLSLAFWLCLSQYAWQALSTPCILPFPLTVPIAGRLTSIRRAGRAYTAGAAIRVSGGFSAAFPVLGCLQEQGSVLCSALFCHFLICCMPGIRTGIFL